jgi:transcriptional regulator with XRE-family HTH domain
MDTRIDFSEFLTSRRARLTPEQVGLSAYGARRVPGLRREEVAVLAGVSVPYYTRLERGNMSGVSESVLEALARALQLGDAERAHLFDLARAAHPATSTRRRRPTKQRPRPSVQWILDALTAPALVLNGRLDILAGNQLGYALYSPMFDTPVRPANTARFAFLDQRAREFYLDWEHAADQVVAILRTEAGRDPYDRNLQDPSESSPSKARTSAPDGPSTTSVSTTPASNTSTILSSVSCTSASREWACQPTRASRSSPSPPNPAPSPRKRWISSRAGR